MRVIKTLMLPLLALPVLAHAQSGDCKAPTISDKRIIEIVQEARKERADLFQPYEKQRVVVNFNQQSCRYAYIEWREPPTPGWNHIIHLDALGRVINAMAGH
tara:strand:- start:5713 stop:6018 length:306 start_codon:yes stop_codon:yes gene_type:complete